MTVDARIPGITLRPDEKVVFIAKPHWIIFVRFVNLFVIPLVVQFFAWKNRVFVLTNRRIIVKEGIISTAQRAVDLVKIQDVSAATLGILGRIMGVGNVLVETGGKSSAVVGAAIPGAQKLCDLIQNQMAQSKRDEMMEMARAMKNQQ